MGSLRLHWLSLIVSGACLVTSFARADEDDPEPPASASASAAPSAAPSAEPSAEPDAAPPAEAAAPPAEAKAAEPAEGGEAPGADEYDIEDAKAAGYEVGEASSDPADGLGVDGKDYELPAATFDGMDGLDAGDIEALSEVTPAEVGELDVDHPMTQAAMDQLEKQTEALMGLGPDDLDKLAAMYLPVIRKKLQETRDKKYDEKAEAIKAKSAARVTTIATALAWLSLSGFLVLLLPFVQRKKYPGQLGKLFQYSALAGASLVVAFLMLTGVLVGMRTAQSELGEASNPGLMLQDATFDAIDDNLDDLAAYPGVVLVPLQQVGAGEKDDLGSAALENVSQFAEDFQVFKSIASSLSFVQDVVGYVPPTMIVLSVLLFFVAIKDLVKDVLAAPGRAMRGEIKSTEVLTLVLRRVGNEMLVTLITIGALFLITIATGYAMALVAYPGMSLFISQLTATIEYVFVQPGASKALIYIGLLGVLLYVILAVGLMVVSGVLFLGKLQAILRARLNNKIPLSNHTAFFKWRIPALLWCLALPVVVLYAMSALGQYLTDKATDGQEFNWPLALLPAPLGLLLGFLVLFLAGYGLKAFLSIAKYKVPTQAMGDAALAQAAQAMQR